MEINYERTISQKVIFLGVDKNKAVGLYLSFIYMEKLDEIKVIADREWLIGNMRWEIGCGTKV